MIWPLSVASFFYPGKCKYFKPKDSDETWSHAENHCNANAVDGYWSWCLGVQLISPKHTEPLEVKHLTHSNERL